jgi:Spy/CpxP family protein refolding chaperone
MNKETGIGMTDGSGRNRGGGRLRRMGMGAALAAALALAAQAQPGGGGGGMPGGLKGRGPDGHGPGGAGGGVGMEFNPAMMRELHLSPDQEKKLKDGRLAVQKKKIQLHSDKAVLELDLKQILSAYPVNKTEALKLADKIAEVDKKMLSLRIESMVQLLSGLTAEQHAKLMALQEEWHEKRKAWMEEMRKDKKDGRDGREGREGKGGQGHGNKGGLDPD